MYEHEGQGASTAYAGAEWGSSAKAGPVKVRGWEGEGDVEGEGEGEGERGCTCDERVDVGAGEGWGAGFSARKRGSHLELDLHMMHVIEAVAETQKTVRTLCQIPRKAGREEGSGNVARAERAGRAGLLGAGMQL